MRDKTKDVSTYILVNIILLLVASLLVGFLGVEYNINKQNIVTEIGEQTNVIIQSIQAEKETQLINIDEEYVVPILINEDIDSTDNSKENQYTNYKYYYYQLDDNSKIIYEYIEKNIENMKSGTYEIKLPEKIGTILNTTNGMDQLSVEFQSAWDAIMLDRVDLFFIDISKINLEIKSTRYSNEIKYVLKIIPNEKGNYLEDGFINETIVTKAKNQVENIRSQIVSKLSGSDYDKILQAHNWIVDNFEYGEEFGNNAYNIYGAFINKTVVCEGYAEALKYILDGAKIPCVLISGIAKNSTGTTENHEWNYVEIDGKWYAIDSTWDDPILNGGGTLNNYLRYKYFLKGSEEININHFPDGNVSKKGICFTYPNIEENKY